MHKTIPAYSESEIGVNAQKLVHATQYHNSEAKHQVVRRRKGRRHLHFRSNRRTLEHLLGQMSLSGMLNCQLLLRQLLRSPPLSCSTPVGQGTGNNDRIGRKIAMTKLQLRWERWQGTGVPDPFRILVVYDRSPNGANPAITSILSANGISTPVNLSNTDRFLILMDIYPCAQQGMTELYMCNKETESFHQRLKLDGQEVQEESVT